VAVLSALGKCAELLCNFGISFEKCSLKQVWQLFSTNLPNLWFSAHFPYLHCSNLRQPFKSHYWSSTTRRTETQTRQSSMKVSRFLCI